MAGAATLVIAFRQLPTLNYELRVTNEEFHRGGCMEECGGGLSRAVEIAASLALLAMTCGMRMLLVFMDPRFRGDDNWRQKCC